MIRFGLSIVFLAVVLFAVLMAINYGEAIFFKEVYTVLPLDITIYDNSLWVEVFQNWAFWGAVLAAGFGLIWVLVGQFKFKVEGYDDAGGFGWWFVLLLSLLLITFIAGFLLIPATQDFGKPLAIGFCLTNSFFIYWFSSAMFSPSTVKYAPWLSQRLAVPANGIMQPFQGGEK